MTAPLGMEKCVGMFGDHSHVNDFVGGCDEGGLAAQPDTALGRYLISNHMYHHDRKVYIADLAVESHLEGPFKKARRNMAKAKPRYEPVAHDHWQQQREKKLMKKMVDTAAKLVDDRLERSLHIDRMRRKSSGFTKGGMRRKQGERKKSAARYDELIRRDQQNHNDARGVPRPRSSYKEFGQSFQGWAPAAPQRSPSNSTHRPASAMSRSPSVATVKLDGRASMSPMSSFRSRPQSACSRSTRYPGTMHLFVPGLDPDTHMPITSFTVPIDI